MSFMARSAKHFVTIKAARQIIKEIEKAGVDNLKILADKGVSIVGTYLDGCSPQEKAAYRRDLNALLQWGITAEMLLDEVARLWPDLAAIMKGRENYKESEIANLISFLRGKV